jgi:hypothetical protein
VDGATVEDEVAGLPVLSGRAVVAGVVSADVLARASSSVSLEQAARTSAPTTAVARSARRRPGTGVARRESVMGRTYRIP